MKERIREVVGVELETLRKRIIENHEQAGQVASGRTRDSLRVELSEDGGALWGRKAFAVLETGRKPGRVPKGFRDIILQWVIDKGVTVKNPKSFAFLVARKIAREGSLLYRQGGGKNIYSKEVQEAVERITKEAAGIFETEIQTINLNFNKE